MLPLADVLPTLNAGLNAAAAVLLLAGLALIKAGREAAHRRTMLAAFGVSVAFLASYLVYHFGVKQGASTPFTGTGAIRRVYYAILLSHVVLAACVPPLAGITIWHGLADRRRQHRRWAKIAFPIWLYVSVTGVAIYVLLYHLYPAAAG